MLEAMGMSHDFGQALFDAIVDSAILIDRNGRIVDWNQNASALFGYSKKEVLGRSVNLVYAQSHPFPKIIQELLSTQKKWSAETHFFKKNGLKGTCKTSVSLIVYPDQTKQLALIIHQNISAYKNENRQLRESSLKAMQEMRDILYLNQTLLTKNVILQNHLQKNLLESEHRFHLLAENSTDIITHICPEGIFLYVSISAKSGLGFLPEELIGYNFFNLVHPDDLRKVKREFNRRKLNNETLIIYRMKHKDGEYRWFESNLRFIRDDKKKFLKEIQTATRDVTERVLDKKARVQGQKLAHVFRLSTMEEMASGMAHEISQPLAAIVNYTRGCVRYLESENHDKNQLTEIMKKAAIQAERAGEVIHRLKNFFCKGQLVKTHCRLNTVIRETAGFIRNELTLSKTKIEYDFDKDIPLITADKIQLQQVILNMMQNAIDAMKVIDQKERRIFVRTQPIETKNVVEIMVRDTGPGFSKEIITKVFKPFFTTKAHGRGMGLAICRSIIEAHGGEFTINANTTNNSWIKFTLPIN
jgi:two-component system sensor kinase FixL